MMFVDTKMTETTGFRDRLEVVKNDLENLDEMCSKSFLTNYVGTNKSLLITKNKTRFFHFNS